MIIKRITKNNKGQSLIELVVAISIILVGVISTLVLTMATIRGGTASEMQTIAGNLAREGMEVVKQQRYNNWLKIESNSLDFTAWDTGLNDVTPSYVYLARFNPNVTPASWSLDSNGEDTTADPCITSERCRIYLENGIYRHKLSGETIDVTLATPFSRTIIIKSICQKSDGAVENYREEAVCLADEIKVGVQVLINVVWQERGSTNTTNSVTLEDHLYNWK
ncbi:MAG: prepilin-type N-terminal cleavage/methylation domain-containing protein [Patescibacteria group bacterium]|jgi:hypothetical protein